MTNAQINQNHACKAWFWLSIFVRSKAFKKNVVHPPLLTTNSNNNMSSRKRTREEDYTTATQEQSAKRQRTEQQQVFVSNFFQYLEHKQISPQIQQYLQEQMHVVPIILSNAYCFESDSPRSEQDFILLYSSYMTDYYVSSDELEHFYKAVLPLAIHLKNNLYPALENVLNSYFDSILANAPSRPMAVASSNEIGLAVQQEEPSRDDFFVVEQEETGNELIDTVVQEEPDGESQICVICNEPSASISLKCCKKELYCIACFVEHDRYNREHNTPHLCPYCGVNAKDHCITIS